MDDTRRPRLAARALWVCALLALIAASVLGVALPADEAAAQVLGGRNFRLTSQGGGQVQLSWSTGSGQTAYRLNRITSAGTVVVAPSLASTATSFTDQLGTSVNVACYQLEILGTGNAVIGTSDILCVIVNVAGGVSPPRNVSITTNESPIITIGWQAPTAGNQIGYLVVPLGRTPLAFLPANATQAVDAPGVPTCYIVLTLIPDSAQVPFRIGGFSDIVCAIPGVFTPPAVQPTATSTATGVPPTQTPFVVTATAPTSTSTSLTPSVTGTLPATSTVTTTGTALVTPTGTATFTPANVVVSKVDSPDPVVAGDNLTYTITVTNLGQSPTGPLFLTDSLPAGLTYLVASGNQSFVCNEVQNTVSCSSPNLPGGQSAVISLLVRADNPCVVVSPVTNVVRTEIGGPPDAQSPSATQQTTILGCVQGTSSPTITRTPTVTPPSATTTATVTVTATPGVDLTINKLDTPDPVVPPSSLQYTLVVQNIGNVAANNISVRDTLDPAIFNGDFTFGSASGEAGFVCTFDFSQTVTCTGGNLGPNGGATISIVLNYNFCGQTYYVNTALVDPANTIAEFNENNNTAVSQTACGAGVATATPIGTSTTTATPTRTATGIPTTVPTTTFSFLKLDAPDPVVLGGSITYTLRLTNSGGNAISGVNVQDNLPAEVTFQQVTSTGGGFVCSFLGAPGPNGTVQCSNGTVPANSTIDINIVVAVTTCISPIVNFATITSPSIANNQATSTTTVSGCPTVPPAQQTQTLLPTATITLTPTLTPTLSPTVTLTVVPTLDIGIAKTVSGFSAVTGDLFSYVVTMPVTGTGTATWAANQISMRDTLPVGVTFVGPVTNDYGATCVLVAGTPERVECSGGSIPAGSTATVTIPVRLDACGTFVNIAEADPNNAVVETNEGNNLTTDNRTNTCDTELIKTVDGLSDTSVNTSAGPASVTYVLTLNDVAAGQTRVAPSTVTDTLPAGFTITSGPTISGGDTGDCSLSTATTVNCTGVSGPDPVTITYTVQVATSVVRGDYANSASVTTPGDVNGANNTDSATVSVYPFDLSVTVVDTQDPVTSPSQYGYQITVTNTSAGGHAAPSFFTAGGLMLRTPPGAQGSGAGSAIAFADVFAVTAAAPVTCTFPSLGFGFGGADQRYVCLVNTLAAGQSVVISVIVDAMLPEPDGGVGVSLDATLSDTDPPACNGGGTDPGCAPERAGVFLTTNPPGTMTINNRDVEFTDID